MNQLLDITSRQLVCYHVVIENTYMYVSIGVNTSLVAEF